MSRKFLRGFPKAVLPAAVLGAGALFAGAAGATSLPTFNAPGIPQAGVPDFVNLGNVSVIFGQIGKQHTDIGGWKAPSGDYLLVASALGGSFNASKTSSTAIGDDIFAMYAEFNSKGQFLSGGETILGCLPGTSCSASKITNLYTAAFDKYGVSTSSVGLGFDTVASTASGWAKQYQKSNESLYLFGAASLASLDSALASGKNLPSFFTATVSEITTVPLPAAAWLFGPAFAALFGIMRRRQPAAVGASAA